MKFVNMSKNWCYSTEPFPAFRSKLVFGRHKKDYTFIPVHGFKETFQTTHVVSSSKDNAVIYSGPSKEAAISAVRCYNSTSSDRWTNYAKHTVLRPAPVDNHFKVIKTEQKGTIIIVPGEDKTNRVLLLCGAKGGFRGDCNFFGTTGKLLCKIKARSACESGVEAAVILEPGQRITFKSIGRRCDNIITFTYNGVNVHERVWQRAEFEAYHLAQHQDITSDAKTL